MVFWHTGMRDRYSCTAGYVNNEHDRHEFIAKGKIILKCDLTKDVVQRLALVQELVRGILALWTLNFSSMLNIFFPRWKWSKGLPSTRSFVAIYWKVPQLDVIRVPV